MPKPETTEKRGRKPKLGPDKKKQILAVTLDPEIITWVKEWSARRDRSVSWALNHFAKERRNRELAEKHLGRKMVR